MSMVKGVILLVEDNQKDEVLAQRAFRKSNMTNPVIVARDGVEALDYLFPVEKKEGTETAMPIAVFLDLKLPRVDGLEVLRRIRSTEKTCHLPVVILTSSDEEKDILSSYRLGANSYVRKPMNSGEFSKAVMSVGIYWAEINESIPHSDLEN
ncbi:MAG: response regulator [Gammaproteobacteria bacterium]|nr:response regulator [Gammaproteobacteria bacterium]